MRTAIDMAREVGLDWLMHNWFYKDHLMRFEALVRADERSECAELVFNSPPSDEYESPLRAVYNAIRARGNT